MLSDISEISDFMSGRDDTLFCSALFLLFLEKSALQLDKLSILLKNNIQRIHCQSFNLKFKFLMDNSDSFNFKLFRNFEFIGDRK